MTMEEVGVTLEVVMTTMTMEEVGVTLEVVMTMKTSEEAGEQCEAAWPSQGRGMVSRGRAGRILICKWQACTGHGRLCRQP